MRRRLTVAATTVLAAVGMLFAVPAAPAQAAALPVDWNWMNGFFGNILDPQTPPPGANDFGCKGTAAKPPVILVHGTWENQKDNWAAFSPFLKNNGYCVFTFNYGGNITDTTYGWKSITSNAEELRNFVGLVRVATGARRVDLVGHSQGGMMPRYYIKNLGGAGKVDDLVGLAPSNHGTTNPGALVAGATFCPACDQQRAGSPFLTALNAGDETPGSVSYTQIETRYDEVVTPYTSAFLAPGPNTANVLLQDACPAEVIDHHEMPNDALAIRWALQALGRTGPADTAHPPSCV